MISRAGDLSAFDNGQMKRIAEAVERAESKHLYDTYSTPEEANIAKQELRVQGFHAESYKVNDSAYEVYAVIPAKVSLAKAEESGAFKKLAFGRYVFQKESSLEMHEYPFNDGSIWRIATDGDGNQILIKEVSDDDEDSVVRDKERTKVASSDQQFSFLDNENYESITHVLFEDNSDLLDALLTNESTKNVIDKFLNGNMLDKAKSYAEEYGITDSAQLKDLYEHLKVALGSQIKDISSFKDFIKEYAASQVEAKQDQHKLLN